MVRWKISRLATHKHPRLKAAHHLGEMLMDGIRARLPRLLQREELRLTLLRCHRIARPQRGIDRLQVLGIETNLIQGIMCDSESTVHTASKAVQQRLCSPPFWACRLRSSESRTSCKASRIRTPGGRSGPPWLSLRIPRTAAQYPSTTPPASSSTGALPGGATPRVPGAQGAAVAASDGSRSEERRVGKECRSRWSPYH